MAEATDHSKNPAEASSGEQGIFRPETGILPGSDLGTMPALETETYRPLSLLAMACFGVAVLYSLIVVVGAVISLINRDPYLMPMWMFVLPTIAIGLGWLARRHIRASEDTLSGSAFVAWGVGLAVVVALNYAFYYGATYWAVRQQAIASVNRFFDLIKKDRLEQAFLSQTVADDDEARQAVEVQFNMPSGRFMRPGYFGQFRQSEYVRSIQRGGDQTRIEPFGVVSWSYEGGGYKVTLKYHIASPVAEFDMWVTTFGRDSKPGEPKGRQWLVDTKIKETSVVASTMRMTKVGDELLQITKQALNTVDAWQAALRGKRWDEAYLATLPVAERERQRGGQQALRLLPASPLGGVASAGLYSPACRDFLAGREAFLDGASFHIDEKQFWTSRPQREAILRRVRRTFRDAAEGKGEFTLNILAAGIPQTQEDGKTLLFDLQFVYMDPTAPNRAEQIPQYLVDGQLAVVPDDEADAASAQRWRIAGIELKKWSAGRKAPSMQDREPAGARTGRAVLPALPEAK